MNLHIKRDYVINILLGVFASVLFAAFTWFLTWIISQPFTISQLRSWLFLVIGLVLGAIIGWRVQYVRMGRINAITIGGYDSSLNFLAQSNEIDMIAITFAGFVKFKKSVQDAIINNHAIVRILLLDPNSIAFQEYAKKLEERNQMSLAGEIRDTVRFINDLQKVIEEERKKYKTVGSIEYRFFDSIPYRGCIITNNATRYWPYLYHLHPESTPTYHLSHNSKIAKTLKNEFEEIWSEGELRKKKMWVVQKIISGGQTGADRAALKWAIKQNIPHGGWCPKGRWAEDGPIDKQFLLQETPSPGTEQRTEWNVRDSDGTVIFSLNPCLTEGTQLTHEFVKKHGKPYIHLYEIDNEIDHAKELLDFLTKNNIRTLNIAGPRRSTEKGIEDFVTRTLDLTWNKAHAK